VITLSGFHCSAIRLSQQFLKSFYLSIWSISSRFRLLLEEEKNAFSFFYFDGEKKLWREKEVGGAERGTTNPALPSTKKNEKIR
jgi:hypothetical protein